jgi:stage III sporulation protein AA
MQDCFVSLCGWAVHSHQKEQTDGYIPWRWAPRGDSGNRAGLLRMEKMNAVRNITSINCASHAKIRRADGLVSRCFTDRLRGCW